MKIFSLITPVLAHVALLMFAQNSLAQTAPEIWTPQGNGHLQIYSQVYEYVGECGTYYNQYQVPRSDEDAACSAKTLRRINEIISQDPIYLKFTQKRGFRVIVETSHHFEYRTKDEAKAQEPAHACRDFNKVKLTGDYLFVSANCDFDDEYSSNRLELLLGNAFASSDGIQVEEYKAHQK